MYFSIVEIEDLEFLISAVLFLFFYFLLLYPKINFHQLNFPS